MKRTLKRFIGKSINILSRIKQIGVRILKVTVQSAVVCFPVTLILGIINSALGVNIRFTYYLLLAAVVTVALSTILCAFKWEQIIAKPIKISKKAVPAKTDKKTQRAIQRKRRRIS